MQSWGLTDKGCVRKMNQDAYEIRQLDRNTLLCVVCDGMGGAKSGNIASSLAVDVFSQEIQRTWTPNMEWDKADQIMKSAVKLANFTVYDQARQFEEFDGMGTTLVAAFIRGRQPGIYYQSERHHPGHQGPQRGPIDGGPGRTDLGNGQKLSGQKSDYPGRGHGVHGKL